MTSIKKFNLLKRIKFNVRTQKGFLNTVLKVEMEIQLEEINRTLSRSTFFLEIVQHISRNRL